MMTERGESPVGVALRTAESALQEAARLSAELAQARAAMRSACILLTDDLGEGDGKTLTLEKVREAYAVLFDALHPDRGEPSLADLPDIMDARSIERRAQSVRSQLQYLEAEEEKRRIRRS